MMPSLSAAPPLLTALAGAVVLGVTGSLHCFAMCGPLACSALPGVGGGSRRQALLGYHLGRSGTYALLGGLLGGMGRQILRVLPFDLRPWAGWVVVLMLLGSALDLWRHVPTVPALRSVSLRVARTGVGRRPWIRAAALGVATGLLPCGLLYAAFGTALVASSFLGGAAVMLAFSLAGMPALLLAQLPFAAAFRAPRLGVWLRRGAPLVAALLVGLRMMSAAPASAAQAGTASDGTASDEMAGMANCPLHAHHGAGTH